MKPAALNLEAIAATSLGQRVIAEIEDARTTQRKAIVERLAAEIASLDKQETKLAAEAKRLEAEVEAKYEAFAVAAQRLHELKHLASSVGSTKDKRRAITRRELGSLGQAAIESTMNALQFEYPQLLGSLQVEAIRDANGLKTGEYDRNPVATERLALVKAYLVDLPKLEFCDITPAEIEARCGAMLEGKYSPEPGEVRHRLVKVASLPMH